MDGKDRLGKNDKKRTMKNTKCEIPKNTYNLFSALVRTPAAAALVLPRKQNPQIRRLHLHPCHQVSSDTEKRTWIRQIRAKNMAAFHNLCINVPLTSFLKLTSFYISVMEEGTCQPDLLLIQVLSPFSYFWFRLCDNFHIFHPGFATIFIFLFQVL